MRKLSPYGKVGDRLWVRESFAWLVNEDGVPVEPEKFLYGATDRFEGPRKPSIHMPRRASRIILEITDVRVEKIKDISEEDCLAEGIRKCTKDQKLWKYGVDSFSWHEWQRTAKDAFFLLLWNQIHQDEDYGCNGNPWVWVIEFKRIEQ